MAAFQSALSAVPEPLRADVERHWNALVEAADQRAVALPEASGQLVRVLAGSEFVAHALRRDPDLLVELSDPAGLERTLTAADFRRQLEPLLAAGGDETAWMTALRRFRRRAMARIAWRDLAELAPLDAILGELSGLAECLLDLGLEKLYHKLCQRYGTPRDAHGKAQQLVILGMGKLGGGELNFSSDIDLIFAYPANGQTDGERGIDNENFFRRLGQALIKLLAEVTAEGFVYRVDMRLRPFGDAGPLAASFSAMEDYYQSHGREWERYALIKARVVAGDQVAGEQLLATLRPFVYRRYLDYSAFESLRRMKALIASEIERKGLRRNVKLGPGGIREIEFIGQAFQLIYGGREPELRQRGIVPVLDYLAASGRLPVPAVTSLKQAYTFLRRSENRLQAWADRQTHDLPEDDTAKLRLAWSMGYVDWKSHVAALMEHVRHVSEQFELVFAAPQTEPAAEESDWSALWNGSVGEERAKAIIAAHGFDEPERALRALQRLRGGFSYRALSTTGRDRLRQLLPLLLEATATGEQPAVTLERLIQLLDAILGRSVYLSLLLENPMALSQLVRLCAASPWIAHYLARYPLLLDDLLNPGSLYQPLDRRQLDQALARELARTPAEDPERLLDALRHFKQSQVLRVAAADVSGALPLMIVSDHLTWIAEALLEQIRQLAWRDLIAKHGTPRCLIDGREHLPGLAVIGYGKLGGIELGYGSDLDLVFLHDSAGERQQTDGPRSLDNLSFFAKLAQRIMHLLNTRTPAGVLYEVDTRLRPSGRSGLLVSSLNAFADYQHKQAWTWEHQALVRARHITGPDALATGFAAIRHEVLCQPRDPLELRRAVVDMRQRMRRELDKSHPGWFHLKQDSGGIIDIEFLVQYLVLAHAHAHPELIGHSDNIRQLDALEQVGIVDRDAASQLRDSYRSLRRRSHRLKLQEQSSLVPDSEFQTERAMVNRLWRTLLETAA